MAHRFVLAGALALAGCLDIPDPPGSDTLEGVSYDGVSVVHGPDYEMQFATGGAHLPVSLKLTAGAGANDELLWHEPSVDTYDGVGLGFANQFAINMDTVPDPGNTGFTASHTALELRGARVVIEVAWSMQNWPATPFDPTKGNVSRFTFYPDGRIVRHDHVNTHPLGVAVQMGSYITLDAAKFASARVDEDGVVVHVVANQGGQNASAARTGSLCLDNAPEERVAVMAWIPPDPFADVEMLLAPGTYPSSASLVVAWIENADVGDATYDMDTLYAVRATGNDCDAVAPDIARGFEAPPMLAGATYQPTSGAYRLNGDVRGGPVTLSAESPVPAGFALEATAAAEVTRDGAALVDGVDFLEDGDASGAVLWFPTALPLGGELVLTVRP